MLKPFLLLGLASASAEVDDDLTLLQLSNARTVMQAPVEKAMQAVAQAKSPVEASMIVKNLTEKAVRGEVTIDDSTKDALKTMLETLGESETLIKDNHDEDQTLRENAAELVANCGANYEAARAEDELAGNEVTSTDDSHEVCRQALKEMEADKKQKCDDLDNFIDGLTPPNCNKPNRDGMEGYFNGLKSHYDSNHDTWKEKEEKCTNAEDSTTDKDEECDNVQGQFETKFCAYRLQMYTTCSEYVGCYSSGQAEFDSVMQTTAIAQESRKIEWTAIKKINCYVAVLIGEDDAGKDKGNDERKEELGKCQELEPDTTHLDLEEPELDDQQACNLAPVAEYPCTDGFKQKFYNGFTGLMECQTCPALPSHIDVENGHVCAPVTDTHDGWSNTKHKNKDGTTFMGPFDHGQKSLTKTFDLIAGVNYKLSVVMDTWGSVDNERMFIRAGDKKLDIRTRGAGDCHNGWTHYAYGYGKDLGSGGSGKHNWQDCWKKAELNFAAPAGGKVQVEMNMQIDQHMNDEAWGWHDLKIEPVNCPAPSRRKIADDCSGWSVDKVHDVDGVCYNGAFDNSAQTVKKTFEGLTPGCTYKWKAVIDTWASVDNEPMRFTVNGQAHNFQSRGAGSCNNGWTEYPNDFGDKVGSHGSRHGGWKDCWKNFEATFTAPNSGKADVEMYMRIDQHINDEGWGWHAMEFERLTCPSSNDKKDTCEGWSVDIKHDVDGTCYMGAFDHRNKEITKTFEGLRKGCKYRWSAVIDTWASVDNERMTFTVNGQNHNFQSRAHHVCNNGWTEYPNDFGDKVGSHGSHHGGWKDCWKNFETEFTAPTSGKAAVKMYMAIDQHINDEGWGWHNMQFQRLSCPRRGSLSEDDCTGWDVDIKHNIDGTCYMGAFDHRNKRIKKTFSGLKAGCTYKWSAVIDTWASVDNERMTFTINGQATNFQSRSHNSCNNGWTEYPNDFGDKVGSHGSVHGGWKDCWKNFEKEFVVPADGKANVDMYMAIDQHINDEGWGWHDMKFEKLNCPRR